MNTLSIIGEQLRASLSAAHTYRRRLGEYRSKIEKVHVVGAGAALTSAYEQLRNAADNTEEHLLVQNAIRRFFRNGILTRGSDAMNQKADELVIELTLAGYLKNDSVTSDQITNINKVIKTHTSLLEALRSENISSEQAMRWILDMLSVTTERELYDHTDDDAFVQFCYEQYLTTIDNTHTDNNQEHETALFIAVHRALLKSDDAVIRADLLRRYRADVSQTSEVISFCQRIDSVMKSPRTERLYRIVYRRAAPERIVRRMLGEDVDVHKLLETKSQFITAYELQVDREYAQVDARLRHAIIRSIIFLFVTKVIIGLSIEIPYDLIVHDSIIWLPLIVNLFFPPLYMALLSLTLRLPGQANKRALGDRIEKILYSDNKSLSLYQKNDRTPDTGGKVFSFGYGAFAAVLIGLITWGLISIGFSIVHLLIFFVFLSTASFLGFRLSRMVRELEVVSSEQSSLTFIRDSLYLPFVAFGRWLSDRYAKVNIVTLVLDMAIELPLKTLLRLVRQWTAFINARKDAL